MELQGADPHTWRRVIRRARLGPSVKLVAYALADYGDSDDGRNVRPGVPRLVNVTELSKSSVVRGLKKLRDLGLVDRVFEGSAFGRRGLSDEYRLTIPVDASERIPMLPPNEGITRTGVTTTPDQPVDNPGTGVTVTPDLAPEPVDNPELPASNQVSADPEQVSPVLGTGVTVTPHLSMHLTSTSPTNKPSGPVTPPSVEVPRTRAVTDSERADLQSEDEPIQFDTARTILARCGADDQEKLMELARQELDNPNVRQLIIRAAQIRANGIPA